MFNLLRDESILMFHHALRAIYRSISCPDNVCAHVMASCADNTGSEIVDSACCRCVGHVGGQWAFVHPVEMLIIPSSPRQRTDEAHDVVRNCSHAGQVLSIISLSCSEMVQLWLVMHVRGLHFSSRFAIKHS